MRLCLGKVLLEVVRRNEFDPSDSYAYGRGNLLSRIDPLGLCDDDEKARCKQVAADARAYCSQGFQEVEWIKALHSRIASMII